MADDLKAKEQVYDLLVERYGAQPLKPRRQPMHELISTIYMPNKTSQLGFKIAVSCENPVRRGKLATRR